MDHGALTLNIERILKARGISKNQICKDLDIPRANFNRYYRNDFQRMDTGLICKLCWYLKVEAGELIEYKRPEQMKDKNVSHGEIRFPTRIVSHHEIYFLVHKGQLAHNGKAGGGKLGDHDVILPAGTVAHQQLPRLVPAHHHADVGGVRVEGKIPRLGVGC